VKPRLLDLFCGAGMAAEGYAAAGWDVVGVDLVAQPDYPFAFVQMNAMSLPYSILAGDYDAVHASPPCQFITRARKLRDAQNGTSKSGDLLTPTLAMLANEAVPWVVENVEDARAYLPGAVRLCGSSFGLDVQRHRLFLSNVPLQGTVCQHDRFPLDPITGRPRPWGVYHVPGDSIPGGGRTARDADHARQLFGMTRSLSWDSIKEGFPPAYTAWIGRQLRQAVQP